MGSTNLQSAARHLNAGLWCSMRWNSMLTAFKGPHHVQQTLNLGMPLSGLGSACGNGAAHPGPSAGSGGSRPARPAGRCRLGSPHLQGPLGSFMSSFMRLSVLIGFNQSYASTLLRIGVQIQASSPFMHVRCLTSVQHPPTPHTHTSLECWSISFLH